MYVEPQVIVEILSRRRKLLMGCVVTTTLLAVAYSYLTPRVWTATQALYVRDEGTGTNDRLGRFDSVDAMQTAQETILQLTQQHAVLESALRDVGPEESISVDRKVAYPDLEAVDSFRKMVSVDAPKGAQFGRTEMIYLAVRARSVDRALKLTNSVADHLIERAKMLRQQKYEGIASELEKTVAETRKAVDSANDKLREIERNVGPDLAELRSISSASTGDGRLQLAANEIERELRQAESELAAKRSQIAQLKAIQGDSRQLIALPSEILDSLPSLKKLKEGLVEAQLNVSRTLSELSVDHPRSQGALDTEKLVRARLIEELQNTVATLGSEIQVAEQKLERGSRQRANTNDRMQSIADIRVQYENAAADVKQRMLVLEKANSELAASRAMVVASSASLIQRVDQPVPSANPLGPGRMVLGCAGAFGGLMLGLGLIFLLEPAIPTSGRRAADQLARGRRSSDIISIPQQGRRNADQLRLAPGSAARTESRSSGSNMESDVPSLSDLCNSPPGDRRTVLPPLQMPGEYPGSDATSSV